MEGRIRWLELLKAVNACLPSDPPRKPDEAAAVPIAERKELHVTNLDCQQVDDVSQWYAGVKQWDTPVTDAGGRAAGDCPSPPRRQPRPAAQGVVPTPRRPAPAPAAAPAAACADGGAASGPDAAAGPKGPGWIVQISGYHYHNADQKDYGAEYVRKTLIENLRNKKVKLPSSEPGVTEEVTMPELGISYPVLVTTPKLERDELANPNAEAADAARGLAPRRA